MPWWEISMWAEMLTIEFQAPGEDDQDGVEVRRTDDLSSMGFNVNTIA